MKILVVVPTRGRPENARELVETFRNTVFERELTHLKFALDDDDDTLREYTHYLDSVQDENVSYEVSKRMRMGPTLNRMAVKYSTVYDMIGFLGDDHRFRTEEWDLEIARSHAGASAIVYGDDLLQGENLPTAVFVSTDIIQILGYMAPPELVHMYLDNFWKDFGLAISALHYHPEIVIEHMHYINGKAPADDQYLALNAFEAMEYDREQYDWYRQARMSHDIWKYWHVKGLQHVTETTEA